MEKKAALTLEERIALLEDEIARCWSRHDGTQDETIRPYAKKDGWLVGSHFRLFVGYRIRS
jgi:hypothetical protein